MQIAQHLIYWPLLAQIAIPILVLLLNGQRKATDRKAGRDDPDAASMDNKAWSKPVVLTSNNLANQTQMPVLFYVLCLINGQAGMVDLLLLGLAWAFVASRALHAWVHVNSNYVPIRFRAFVFGVLILIVMFVLTILKLAAL